MFLVTFVVCLIVLYCAIKFGVRHALESSTPGCPKNLPFPLWLHLVFGAAAWIPAWLLSEFIAWSYA